MKTNNSIPIQPSVIVITGVTRGLGRSMVDEFVRLGHRVLGCGRSRGEIRLLTSTYPAHDFQAVDVSSSVQVAAWARRLLKRHGPPDYVLNNAAVINMKAPLWEVGDQEFSDEIDINIKGVVNVIRNFVPSMIDRNRGVIVSFSSRWGDNFEKHMAPYCATKWAVVALTRVLAEELKADGIAAIGLNPGIVKTGMLKRYLGTAPISKASRYLTPAQWAKAAVPYILSLQLKDTGKILKVPNNNGKKSI
jgi:NAD(P)-dependent dehydrogenase (short-subunit alcohol dehydrogenase family)